jgi:hypothetical protein
MALGATPRCRSCVNSTSRAWQPSLKPLASHMRTREAVTGSPRSTARERRFWAGRRHNRGPLQGTNTEVPGPQILRTRSTPPPRLIQLERVGSPNQRPSGDRRNHASQRDRNAPVDVQEGHLPQPCNVGFAVLLDTPRARLNHLFRHIAWIDRSAEVERESGQSTCWVGGTFPRYHGRKCHARIDYRMPTLMRSCERFSHEVARWTAT